MLEYILKVIDTLKDRHDEMRADPNDLFGSRFSGDNSWRGHQKAYYQYQKRLQDKWEEFQKKCKDIDPGESNRQKAFVWSLKPAPERPDSFDFSVNNCLVDPGRIPREQIPLIDVLIDLICIFFPEGKGVRIAPKWKLAPAR
jgi:hypothetical protein